MAVPSRELFIGGRWVKAHQGGRLPIINPFDSSTIGTIPAGKAEDIQVSIRWDLPRPTAPAGLSQPGSSVEPAIARGIAAVAAVWYLLAARVLTDAEITQSGSLTGQPRLTGRY